MDRSPYESFKPVFKTDYEFLKEDFYSKEFETNVSFFIWFEEYAKGKRIDYPFSSFISVTHKLTQVWTTSKGEKITSELPPTKSFVMETKDPNKLVVASPFKIRDSKQLVSLTDIQFFCKIE